MKDNFVNVYMLEIETKFENYVFSGTYYFDSLDTAQHKMPDILKSYTNISNVKLVKRRINKKFLNIEVLK